MKPRIRLSPIWLFGFFCARLAAQDVTVGEIAWASPDPAPSTLPKSQGRLHPEFPPEMRNAPGPGYAVLQFRVKADGEGKNFSIVASHSTYVRVVQAAYRDWQGVNPAKRDGKAVDTQVSVPIIFNPSSAPAKGPNAIPRLLGIVPVVAREPRAKDEKPNLRMRIAVDATGAITSVTPEDPASVKPSLLEDISQSVRRWRFAPARKEGQAIEAEVTVGMAVQYPSRPDTSNKVAPVIISQVRPLYPYAMRRFGMSGKVTFDFEIDVDGSVVNPVVYESDNPLFEKPALDALFQWKYKPGTKDGKPEKTKVRQAIHFEIENRFGEKQSVFVEKGKDTDQSKLPAELRYDTPAKFRGVMIPVLPYEARQAGAQGKAEVAIAVDPRGRVSGVKVLSADRPDLGLALTAAAEGFRFDPAYKDGKPVDHILRFTQEFNDAALGDEESDRLMSLEKKHPEKIFGGDKLDAPLVPRSRRPPVFPIKVAAGASGGEALIEFLVDTDGHARLPRVVSASEEAFGYAAVQAVSTWLFTPPLANGKPVVARVRVPLNFKAKIAKAVSPAESSTASPAAPENPAPTEQK